MIDDVSDIAALYDDNPEREDLRLERHQLERDVTWRYLNEYLPPEGSILEIGAGTGTYTLELAGRGYALTVVDLSQRLIEICRKRNKIYCRMDVNMLSGYKYEFGMYTESAERVLAELKG